MPRKTKCFTITAFCFLAVPAAVWKLVLLNSSDGQDLSSEDVLCVFATFFYKTAQFLTELKRSTSSGVTG